MIYDKDEIDEALHYGDEQKERAEAAEAERDEYDRVCQATLA